MKITAIKEIAKKMGINPATLKKPDLILAIQKKEGSTPCFDTGTENCPHLDCCWREDCIS